MNAQLARAQHHYDAMAPDEYYDNPAALERAHQKAINDFWDVGFISIPTHCQSRRYAREAISLDLDEVFEAVSTGGKNDFFFPLRRAIRQKNDDAIAEAAKCFVRGMDECAEEWIKKNVGAGYGQE